MADQSDLDTKYFVSDDTYNCPFCNRRHVSFAVSRIFYFNWTETKMCLAILVKCMSCEKVSMHLTFEPKLAEFVAGSYYRFTTANIDPNLFYSVPSAFHVIDERIPAAIRELVDEAEGCLKSTFLTGASACIRKVIYELAVRFEAEGDHYDERIKSLKDKLPNVDPSYFDTLLTVQELTSDKVHEESYDGWESAHVKLLLAAELEILREIYVVPEERKAKRSALLKMKQSVFGEKTPATNDDASADEPEG